VRNQYNLVQREDDALVDSLARQNIVPFFALGGSSRHARRGDARYRQNLPAAKSAHFLTKVPPRRKQVIAAAIYERMICAAS
jgi:hypothetical protein